MKISLKKWAEENGITLGLSEAGKIRLSESPGLMGVLEEAILDRMCPALCDDGCEVEPDGRCSHDAPSFLIACGMI